MREQCKEFMCGEPGVPELECKCKINKEALNDYVN